MAAIPAFACNTTNAPARYTDVSGGVTAGATGSAQAVSAAVAQAQAQAQGAAAGTAPSGVTITPSQAGAMGQAAAAAAASQPAAQAGAASAAQPQTAPPQGQAAAEEPVVRSMAELGVHEPDAPLNSTLDTLGYLASMLSNPKVAASAAGSRVDNVFQQMWATYQKTYSVWTG